MVEEMVGLKEFFESVRNSSLDVSDQPNTVSFFIKRTRKASSGKSENPISKV